MDEESTFCKVLTSSNYGAKSANTRLACGRWEKVLCAGHCSECKEADELAEILTVSKLGKPCEY